MPQPQIKPSAQVCALTRDQNLQLFGLWDNAPTNLATPARAKISNSFKEQEDGGLRGKAASILKVILMKKMVYGENVCVTSKFIYWNPTPTCDDIRSWSLLGVIRITWGYEGRALRRVTRTLSLCSPPCEDTPRSCCLQPGRVPSLNPTSWHLVLDLPACRTGEKWVSVVSAPQAMVCWYSSPNWLTQIV